MAKRTSGKLSLGLSDVATARGRRAVRKYIDTFMRGEIGLGESSSALEHLRTLGTDTIPAFAEVLVEGNPAERVLAAWIIWSMGQRALATLPPKATEECVSILVDSLKDEDLSVFSCLLLSTCPIPPRTMPGLRKLVHHNDPRIAVPAAAALSQGNVGGDVDVDIGQAVKVVGAAIRGEDQILATVAGRALIRLGVRAGEAERKLQQILPKLSDELQYAMLQTIREIGPGAKTLFDAAAEILGNATKHPSLREAAAWALGAMTVGSSKALPMLKKAFSSSHWQVVNGALYGLEAVGPLPDETLKRLIVLMDHEDDNMRLTAYSGVVMMGTRATAAIPVLVRRLGEEQSVDIAGEMVKALAAIGDSAVERLIDIVVEGDGPRCEYAMQAIAKIGSNAARTLAELLTKTENARVRKMVIGTLMGMGRRATPAIPVVATILDDTDDDELATYAVQAIWVCGPSAVEAIGALLRCIAIRGCDDPVGMWAERAIWSMRERVIPEITSVIKDVSGIHRNNLEQALKRLDSSFGSDLGRLLHYNRDDLFALFVDVGTVLEEQGPTSWRKMAEILSAKKEEGLLTPGYAGSGERFIGKSMASLNKCVNSRLTTHGYNQKGGLTPEGRALLKEAREYLGKKSLERERFAKESR